MTSPSRKHACQPEGGDPMSEVTLNAADAAELAELLQFIADWLTRDPARLGASLEDFAGHPAYDTRKLRDELDRFIFLPGGSDGEPLRPGKALAIPQ